MACFHTLTGGTDWMPYKQSKRIAQEGRSAGSEAAFLFEPGAARSIHLLKLSNHWQSDAGISVDGCTCPRAAMLSVFPLRSSIACPARSIDRPPARRSQTQLRQHRARLTHAADAIAHATASLQYVGGQGKAVRLSPTSCPFAATGLFCSDAMTPGSSHRRSTDMVHPSVGVQGRGGWTPQIKVF